MRKFLSLFVVIVLGSFFLVSVAFAIPMNRMLIPEINDMPPESVNFDGPPVENIFKDPNILAAVIGVFGLLIGSSITIFATYVMRWMDNMRDDKREDYLIERQKKEKEYHMKQEIYKHFLHELAELEMFNFKDDDNFKRAWNRTEMKVDLIASSEVRDVKKEFQDELLAIAKKNIKDRSAHLSDSYMVVRDKLLDAIRKDLDILQN